MIGRFEDGASGVLYQEGATIAGTGFHGTVTLSYQGSSGVGSAGNDVTLTLLAAPGLAGDYNGDGFIDAADYTVWRDTLGSTTNLAANGEMNGASAGVIDHAEYLVWKNSFVAQWAAGARGGVATPEPACWAQLLAAIGVVFSQLLRNAKSDHAATS